MSTTPEAAIRSIISTYAQAVTARDDTMWASTWSESGVWELMGTVSEGRDAAVAFLNGVMGGIAFVYQLPGEASIEVDASGERATGRVPTVEFAKFPDGSGTLLLGTYHDVYVHENGHWLFGERRMKIQYMGPPDLSGTPS